MVKLFQKYRDALWATAIYALWTVIATYPTALRARDSITESGDPLLNLWIIRWNQYALRNIGRIDLFDANIFYPYSDALAFSENLTFTAILFWPLHLLTDNQLLIYNWILLLSFLLTALAMYALAREVLPRAFWGAIVAGAIFTFAHYRIGQLARLQYITAYLLPLTLLFAIRFGRKRRWSDAILLGLTVGLQFWTNIYYAFFSVPILLLFGLFYAIGNWRTIRPKMVLQTIVAGAVAGAVVAPSIQSYLHAGDILGTRPIDAQSGASIASYVTIPQNNWLLGAMWPDSLQQQPYFFFPGVIALLLAIVAARQWSRGTWLDRYWPTLAAVMLIFSFGTTLMLDSNTTLLGWMPYRFVFTRVSLLEALRVPARFAAPFMLALAMMAGQGFAQLCESWPRSKRRLLWILLLLLLEYASLPQPSHFVHAANAIEPVYHWLADQPPNSVYIEYPTARTADVTGDLLTIERLNAQQYRSIYHWQPSMMGYSGGVPLSFGTTVQLVRQFPAPPALDFLLGLDTRYVIVHYDRMTPLEQHTMREGVAAQTERITLVETFDRTAVYQLHPPIEQALHIELAAQTNQVDHFFTASLRPTSDASYVAFGERDLAIDVVWANGVQSRLRHKHPSVIPAGGVQVPIVVDVPPDSSHGVAIVSAAGHTAQFEFEFATAQPPLGMAGTSKMLTAQDDQTPYLSHWQLPQGDRYVAGSALLLQLYWQQLPPGAVMNSYVHLFDRFGNKLAQQDVTIYPDAVGSAEHQLLLDLPRDLPPGDYALRAGAYQTLDEQTIVEVATIEVTQPTPLQIERPTALWLGERVQLLGFDINESCPDVKVTLYWQKSAELTNQTAFVHLVDDAGQLVAQNDTVPRGGLYPLSEWAVGEIVLDNHHLLAHHLGEMPLHLYVGMYDSQTQQNLPIYAEEQLVAVDRVQIGTLDRAGCHSATRP